jgi:hypothetical protein
MRAIPPPCKKKAFLCDVQRRCNYYWQPWQSPLAHNYESSWLVQPTAMPISNYSKKLRTGYIAEELGI